MPDALFYVMTCLLSAMAEAPATILTASNTAKPECDSKCGKLIIPYPFGIGPACSLSPIYSLTCNITYDPPKAFLVGDKTGNFSDEPRRIHEVLDISETQFHVRNMVVPNCINSTEPKDFGMLLPLGSPFVFSKKSIRIVTVGCEFFSKIKGLDHGELQTCSSHCNEDDDVKDGNCSDDLDGDGCKNEAINHVLRGFHFYLDRQNHVSDPFDPCGYIFNGNIAKFTFSGVSDFYDSNVFVERTLQSVLLVVDWVIDNQTCKDARKHTSGDVCQQNATCVDADSGIGGYWCRCCDGYRGQSLSSSRMHGLVSLTL